MECLRDPGQRHDFTDHLSIGHSRITTNYTQTGMGNGYDKQEWLYDGGQKVPGKYVNGSRDETGISKNKVLFYNGNLPCSGESPTTINLNCCFFSWLRNGQAPHCAPRDNEEGQSFWKGLAPNGHGTDFAVIGDDQMCTNVIDLKSP